MHFELGYATILALAGLASGAMSIMGGALIMLGSHEIGGTMLALSSAVMLYGNARVVYINVRGEK